MHRAKGYVAADRLTRDIALHADTATRARERVKTRPGRNDIMDEGESEQTEAGECTSRYV